jgi:hypothetical protein
MRYDFGGSRLLKGRLLNFLMVLALLLCVAVVSLWIRSHWVSDDVAFIENKIERPHDHGELSREFNFQSGAGVVKLSVSEIENRHRPDDVMPTRPRRQFGHSTRRPASPPPLESSTLGRRWRWGYVGAGDEAFRGSQVSTDERYVVLPYWLVLCALSPSLCFSFLSWNRGKRRKRLGLCRHCGYDLRATPGRCPECGTPASVSVTG